MSTFPFKISDPKAKNRDGEIDSDGLVDLQSALGVRLGSGKNNYFGHMGTWSVNKRKVRGSWYRLYSGPWDLHNHASIHRSAETGRWLFKNIISKAGPNVGAERVTTWKGRIEPFSRKRPTVIVLLHGATNDPASAPGESIGQLPYARTYWGFHFVSTLLGNTDKSLYTLSGTELTQKNWETTSIRNVDVANHIILTQTIPSRSKSIPQLSVMLTYRDGSKSLAEQSHAASNQIKQLYGAAYEKRGVKPQIILLGHSMGGLVARYIACNPSTNSGNKSRHPQENSTFDFVRAQTLYMITLASPHEGTPQADKWSTVYESLQNNAPTWLNSIYKGAGTDGFPYSIDYMGGNNKSTLNLRKDFWLKQNQGPLAPYRAQRPNGGLIPLYALGGRTPGGRFFDDPNEPLGGVSIPLSREEYESLGLVLFDKTLHDLPGGVQSWGKPPTGLPQLDSIKRTSLETLAGTSVDGLAAVLKLGGSPLTTPGMQVYLTNMPFYLNEPWRLLTANEMAQALRDRGVQTVASMLKQLYLLSSKAAAKLLKDMQFNANEIAGALKDVYDLNAEKMAEILKIHQVGVNAIVGALKDVYDLNAEKMAEILRIHQVGVNAIAEALKDVYDLNAEKTAEILKIHQVGVNAIAEAMDQVYNLSAQKTAKLLQRLQFKADAIAKALLSAYNLGANSLATILKSIKYSAQTIAKVLIEVVSLSVKSAATILETLAFNAQTTAQALKNLDYSADTIAETMRDVYGMNAQATAQVLKNLNYNAQTIAEAMHDVFNKNMVAVATILRDLNFPTRTIFTAIENAFNVSAAAVAQAIGALFAFKPRES